MTPTLSLTVDSELIRAYGGGGNNIHANVEAAKAAGFDDLVCWGGLTSLPFYDLVAMAFGEDWMTGGSLEIRFTKPVLLGDTIEYRFAADAADNLIHLEAVTKRHGIVAQATARVPDSQRHERTDR